MNRNNYLHCGKHLTVEEYDAKVAAVEFSPEMVATVGSMLTGEFHHKTPEELLRYLAGHLDRSDADYCLVIYGWLRQIGRLTDLAYAARDKRNDPEIGPALDKIKEFVGMDKTNSLDYKSKLAVHWSSDAAHAKLDALGFPPR